MATNSLYIAFQYENGDTPLCFWQYSFILMAIMLLPLQLRTLHALRYAALVSDAAVVAALVMIFAQFGKDGRASNVVTTASVPKNDFLDGYNQLSSFIWAFMGQSASAQCSSPRG